MARKYYTLVERNEDGKWYPQFGDYDREVVQCERESYIEGGDYKAKNLKIVTTLGARQHLVDAAIAKLNAKP